MNITGVQSSIEQYLLPAMECDLRGMRGRIEEVELMVAAATGRHPSGTRWRCWRTSSGIGISTVQRFMRGALRLYSAGIWTVTN